MTLSVLTWVTTTVQAPAAAARTKLAFVPIDFDPLLFKYSLPEKVDNLKYKRLQVLCLKALVQ